MKIKILKALFVLFLITSCHFKEDIYISENGSGQIEAECARDENIYMQSMGEEYFTHEEFIDSTYLVKDVIEKEKENFSRFLPEDQSLLRRYENVKVRTKKDSYAKEYRKLVSLAFKNINEVEDLTKVYDYVDDLQNNYPMKPEDERTHLNYTFDGTIFRRNFKVLNQERYDEYKETIQNYKQVLNVSNFSYTASYHFPREVKSVSNPDAVLSADKKTVTLKMSAIDCLDKPELAFLEVVLEK